MKLLFSDLQHNLCIYKMKHDQISGRFPWKFQTGDSPLDLQEKQPE